jgi:hypothetical protein
VCRHTAKRTKVLYRVLTHGKEATCQQSVDLGDVFWTKWSENCRKHTVKIELQGKGRHTVKSWSPHPATLATRDGSGITMKPLPCVGRHTVKIC